MKIVADMLGVTSICPGSEFSSHCSRVVLGTGRLTIARAIGKFFFGGGGGGKMNLENFQRKKKKKNIVGIRTHAHSFNSPVQLPLAHRNTAEKVCLNYFFMIQLFLLLALTSPNPNPSQVLALSLALTITMAPRHPSRISFNIPLILAFPVF